MANDQHTLPWEERCSAHIYLAHFRVRHHELDSLGHVNNATYLNYLEQAAIDHSAAAGYDEIRLQSLGGTFVAHRHEIDYLRSAHAGDWLRVTTWIAEFGAARAVRVYQINRVDRSEACSDGLYLPNDVPLPIGELFVTARTEWVWVDVKHGRPRRIPEEIIQAFIREDVRKDPPTAL